MNTPFLPSLSENLLNLLKILLFLLSLKKIKNKKNLDNVVLRLQIPCNENELKQVPFFSIEIYGYSCFIHTTCSFASDEYCTNCIPFGFDAKPELIFDYRICWE